MIPIKHKIILFTFQFAGYVIGLCAGVTLYFDYYKVGKPPLLPPPSESNACELVVNAPCLCNSTNQYYLDLLKNLDELKVPFRIEPAKNCNCPKEEHTFILPDIGAPEAGSILTTDDYIDSDGNLQLKGKWVKPSELNKNKAVAHNFEKPINRENLTTNSNLTEIDFLSKVPCSDVNLGEGRSFSINSYYVCDGVRWRNVVIHDGTEYLVLE